MSRHDAWQRDGDAIAKDFCRSVVASDPTAAVACENDFIVEVGSHSTVCSVRISSATAGSPTLQPCVRQRLAIAYPEPTRGCVVLTGTLAFHR